MVIEPFRFRIQDYRNIVCLNVKCLFIPHLHIGDINKKDSGDVLFINSSYFSSDYE